MNIQNFHDEIPVLFDGATGTEYQSRGLNVGNPPEIMTMSHPVTVEGVHRDYIDAGARVIETNTFGGNRIRLTEFGLESSIIEINKRAAEIALRVANGKAVVAGSVGPLGKLLEPYGDLHMAEALEAYGEQIRILLQSGIEFILIETMISLDEALVALQAAEEAGAATVGVTLTFDSTPEGPRTPFGEAPSNCVENLEKHGADIVGSNCGGGFDTMRSVAREMKNATKKPILIQANAGIPVSSGGKAVYPESPTSFAEFVRDLSLIGVHYIGGCCGTTPQHIIAAKIALQNRS